MIDNNLIASRVVEERCSLLSSVELSFDEILMAWVLGLDGLKVQIFWEGVLETVVFAGTTSFWDKVLENDGTAGKETLFKGVSWFVFKGVLLFVGGLRKVLLKLETVLDLGLNASQVGGLEIELWLGRLTLRDCSIGSNSENSDKFDLDWMGILTDIEWLVLSTTEFGTRGSGNMGMLLISFCSNA